jgi:RHS repeat-associated protein
MGTRNFSYDAEGARIGKGTLASAPGSYTATCAPPFGSGFTLTNRYLVDLGGDQVTELNGSGVWQHSNVWAGGKLVATYDTKGIHFELTDPLGTKRVQANAQGQVDETCTSLPFGNEVGNSPGANCAQPGNQLGTGDDATEHHFTGKERDSESGNDYFLARYYSSAMGRFMSPDWSAKVAPIPYAKLDDPQSLNLYVYAHNNPLRNVDVDGHCDSSSKATANTKCQDVSNLHVNDAMKDKLKQSEGESGGKPMLEVKDIGDGHHTVGWGHVDDSLKLGDKIDEKQAQAYFDKDVSTMESKVADVLTSNGGHQFSQGEFNALTDLAFNAGPGVLSTDKSPNLMKNMNAGDYEGMSGQLKYTKTANGASMPGLQTRSDDRKAIFLGGDPE